MRGIVLQEKDQSLLIFAPRPFKFKRRHHIVQKFFFYIKLLLGDTAHFHMLPALMFHYLYLEGVQVLQKNATKDIQYDTVPPLAKCIAK